MSRRILLAFVAVAVLWQSAGLSQAPARAAAPQSGTARVTFSETIAPIVYEKCVTCHRPGEAAPFSLVSYEDVAKRGALIAKVTASRYMPPWHATHGYGEFADERRLTDEQIAAIGEWVKQGMPRGDGAKMPRVPEFSDGWHLGKPDLILEMPAGYSVPAAGPDQFRNFVLPTKLTEDKWVRAVEFRPSARKVVHHAIFTWIKGGAAASRDGADGKPGFPGVGLPGLTESGALGGWATGGTPTFLPEGLAARLPMGSDFVLQTHFHLSGKPETERSLVGLYFAARAPERRLINIEAPPLFAFGRALDIAPGAKNHSIEDSLVLPVDVRAYAVSAHAHYLGREMKADATLPDGTQRPLLWIKDWDFNWQDSYTYKQPLDLPKGTRIDVKVVYDNSTDNPRNPRNPPRRVKFGLQSQDEMGAVSLLATARTKEDEQALMALLGERAKTALQAAFKNGDLVRMQQVLRIAEAPSQRITLVDRQGATVATMGEPGLLAQPAFSPDGSRVAAILTNRDSGYGDIWIYDTDGKGRALTADEEGDSTPVWSPDGRQIAYVRADFDTNGIYVRAADGAADGSARAELVYKHTTGAPLFLTDWSNAGLLCFWTGESIYALPLNGDRKPVELLRGRAGRISPDGRLIAYSDNNGGGPMKTYVRRLNLSAPATEVVQVHDGTALGGLVWRADGKALTFTSLAGLQVSGVWQVEISDAPTLAVGPPQMLFRPVGVATPAQLSSFATRDLERFLTLVPVR